MARLGYRVKEMLGGRVKEMLGGIECRRRQGYPVQAAGGVIRLAADPRTAPAGAACGC